MIVRHSLAASCAVLLLGAGLFPPRVESRADQADYFAQSITHLQCPDRIILTSTGFIPFGDVPKLRRDDPTVLWNVPGFTPMRRGGVLDVRDHDARVIWNLWRRLMPGNGAGCFGPGYLIEFYKGTSCYLRASICFHCSNVALSTGRGIDAIGGDARALARLKRHIMAHLPPFEPATNQTPDPKTGPN